jgi:hypothetical protein
VILLLVRGRPITYSDTGIFLTVAQEILNGGRLYVDVIDNKDPLFYYSQAVALATAGWRGPFLADALWLTIAGASSFVLLRLVTRSTPLAFLGLVLYPLLLTGFHYWPGMSGTPGLSLLPLLAYLALSRRPVLAGVAAGALLLLKLNLAPLVVLVIVAALLIRRRGWTGLLWRTGAGLGAVYACAFALLALRGEAGGYISTVIANQRYANNVLPVVYGNSGVGGHWAIVTGQTPTIAAWLGIGGVLATALLIACSGAVRRRALALAVLTGAAWIGALVVLALTAVWDHHLQILAFPLGLTWGLLIWCVGLAVGEGLRGAASARRVRSAAMIAATACVLANALLLAPPSADNLRAWGDPPAHPVADGLLAAAGTSASEVRYAHLGQGDEYGLAAFLPSNFRLACPYFQQYAWTPESDLNATMDCLATRTPDFVVVTPFFSPDRQLQRYDEVASAPWRQFYVRASAWLSTHCTARLTAPQVTVFACTRAPGDAARGRVPA